MELIPPSLTNMGVVLFGPIWEQPLAYALNVTEDEVRKWGRAPASIPAGLETELHKIGQIRMMEIHIMLGQMKETGLAREVQD